MTGHRHSLGSSSGDGGDRPLPHQEPSNDLTQTTLLVELFLGFFRIGDIFRVFTFPAWVRKGTSTSPGLWVPCSTNAPNFKTSNIMFFVKLSY